MNAFRFILTIVLTVFISNYLPGQASEVKDDLNKAQDLANKGNTEEASKIYLNIMSSCPDNREAVQGWLMINIKRTPTGEEEAIGQLSELEKSYPKNTAILFFKTFLLTGNKHFDEALTNADKLTGMQPDNAINWLMEGQILEAVNKNDDAISAYNKAILLDSTNSDSWQSKAGLLAKTNKLDEAIYSYSRAIKLAPEVAVFIYNRGCAYCRIGDNGHALSDLQKAISMDPQFKSYAPRDEDYKSLWDNDEFKKCTSQ